MVSPIQLNSSRHFGSELAFGMAAATLAKARKGDKISSWDTHPGTLWISHLGAIGTADTNHGGDMAGLRESFQNA